MITKMDKYSMIAFHADMGKFLVNLQAEGMMDISRQNKAIDDYSAKLFDYMDRYTKIAKKLKTYKETHPQPDSGQEIIPDVFASFSAEELLVSAEECFDHEQRLKEELFQLQKDYEEAKVWGALHKNDLDKIADMGYGIHFFYTTEKKFDQEWENQYALHILNKIEERLYFIILVPKAEEFKFVLPEIKMPQKSYDLIDGEICEKEKLLKETSKKLMYFSFHHDRLLKEKECVEEKFDLHLANSSSQKEAEGSIVLLTGFTPVENREKMTAFLDNSDIYYIREEASGEDNPPIKLKNNAFARLFEPIGSLYMLPKYGTLDLTPYFAPFYMLFFGACLGDGGYGLVFLLLGTILKYKFLKFKPYLSLIQWLGIGAIVMSALSGTFFGAKIYDIIQLPDNIKDLFFTDLQMFWFAIIFGIFHIIIAKLIKAFFAIKYKGLQYGLSEIGWAILISWVSISYASTMNSEIAVPSVLTYAAIIGAALVLFFSSTSRNIFKRLAGGVGAVWDITGIFGDVLSYIRLFGLGASGGILGLVMNSIAMSLGGVPYVGWALTLIMLIFGHAFVLVICSIGAFVHPMRLTFVEFYKHADFEGGGKEFRPLKTTIN